MVLRELACVSRRHSHFQIECAVCSRLRELSVCRDPMRPCQHRSARIHAATSNRTRQHAVEMLSFLMARSILCDPHPWRTQRRARRRARDPRCQRLSLCRLVNHAISQTCGAAAVDHNNVQLTTSSVYFFVTRDDQMCSSLTPAPATPLPQAAQELFLGE